MKHKTSDSFAFPHNIRLTENKSQLSLIPKQLNHKMLLATRNRDECPFYMNHKIRKGKTSKIGSKHELRLRLLFFEEKLHVHKLSHLFWHSMHKYVWAKFIAATNIRNGTVSEYAVHVESFFLWQNKWKWERIPNGLHKI